MPLRRRRAADVNLARRTAAEAVGTALLLVAVVGSGIMAQRLAGGNAAIALLANSLATGGALAAIILAFGPISGAHLNPAVTIADAWRGGIAWRHVPAYVAAQFVGAAAGVAIADLMFGLPAFGLSHRVRAGVPQLTGEFVATFGLLAVIWGCARSRPDATPFAVAAYIVGAYWCTSSTSFANPAVTIARALTDTFAGIRFWDVGPFIVAQLLGAAAATALFGWLLRDAPRDEAAPNAPSFVDGRDAVYAAGSL
jgi:glycerol uptake facilitator-like aquaporin